MRRCPLSTTARTLLLLASTLLLATVRVEAQTLSALSVSPTSVVGGNPSTGTVTLSANAPSGGTVVSLSSGNAAATVPASVTVTSGTKTASFPVPTTGVSATTSAVITASLSGTNKTATLSITKAALTSVSLNPASVVGGATGTGTVTLTGFAPAGGAVVGLTSSKTQYVTVPANVTVAQNARTATFPVSTVAVTANQTSTITASYSSVSKTATQTVVPLLASLSLNQSSVVGGVVAPTGTVTLNGPAPAGGTVVTLTSSATTRATVPASITVPAGASLATFSITTLTQTSAGSATITAANGGVSKTASLDVRASAAAYAVTLPASAKGGTTVPGSVALNGPAPAGGATVTLTSSNTAAATVPASLVVAAGQTSASFNVSVLAVASNASTTITAAYGGLSKTATLSVTPATAILGVTLAAPTLLAGTTTTGTVTLNGPAPTGNATVSLTSSSTTTATVPASVVVTAGQTSATFTVTAAASPSAASATLTATYSSVSKTATVAVTTSVVPLSVTLAPPSLIGGNGSIATVTLDGPAPTGGLVVTLFTSNPAGAAPATVTVPSGQTTATAAVTSSPVASATDVALQAFANGTFASGTLAVQPALPTSVSLSPSSVAAGATSTATFTLSGAAPSGGAVVALSSSNTSGATVPATATVPAGQASTTFTVTTLGGFAGGTVTIGATRWGTSASAGLTITTAPAVLSTISVAPSAVTGGSSATGTATLTKTAPTGGAVVSLTGGDAAVTVPASVTVPVGQTSTTFSASTQPVATQRVVTLTGVYGGVTKTANLTVNAPTLSSVGLSASSVKGGTPVGGTVTLGSAAPAGGLAVSLSSSSPSATVSASVTVPAGQTTAAFSVSTTPVGSATPLTITATLAGVNRTAALTLEPAALVGFTINPPSMPAGGTATGTLTLDAPAAPGGASMALSSSDTNVATVPPSVLVAGNGTSTTFVVTGAAVSSDAMATISATLSGITLTADVTVTRAIGTLTGTVLDASIAFALPDAHVWLAERPEYEAYADGEGAYQLLDVPAGTYTLQAAYGEEFGAGSSAAVTLANGQAIVVPPISLVPNPATITGTVRNPDQGDVPVAGVSVTEVSGLASTTTDAAGRYVISGVAPGFTRLTLHKTGYISEATGTIDTNRGLTRELDMPLRGTPPDAVQGTARGTVRDTAGSPISGAVVSVPGLPGVSTVTGADGTFQLPVPPAFWIVLQAEKSGFVRVASEQRMGAVGPRPWQLVQDFTLPLASQTASVQVQAYDPVSRAPGSGETWLRTPAGIYRVRVPASGTRALTQVPPGPVWDCIGLRQVPPGTSTLTCPGDAVIPAGSPRWSAAGQVVDRYSLAPVTGATVWFRTGAFAESVSTDALGRFSFSGGPVGAYGVTAEAPGYVTNPPWEFLAEDDPANGRYYYATFYLDVPPGALVIDTPTEAQVLTAEPASIGVSIAGGRPGDGLLALAPSLSSGNLQSWGTTFSADGRSAVISLQATVPNGPLTLGVEAFTQTGAVLQAERHVTVDVAARVDSLSVTPGSVLGGQGATGTVHLQTPAPAGGTVVALSSSHSAVAVPPSATVPEGQQQADFAVTTTPVDGSLDATLGATAGGATVQATLSVSPAALSSLGLSSSSVPGGTPVTGTVTLTGPAGPSGALVSLSSSDTGAATVPATVLVAAGATQASFTVTTLVGALPRSATVTATLGGTSRSAGLTVRGTPPLGEMTEGNAASWAAFSADSAAATVSDDATRTRAGSLSLKLVTASSADTGIRYPASGDLHWDLSGRAFVTFWAYAVNGSPGGFTGSQPVVVLRGPSGSLQLTPPASLMTLDAWRRYEIPLSGYSIWTRTTTGSFSLSDVNSIEVHHLSPGGGFTIYYDDFALVEGLAGDLAEGTAAGFGTFASDGRWTGVYDDSTRLKSGAQAIRLDTTSGADTGLAFPIDGEAHWDLSTSESLGFWEYAINGNGGGFQGAQPVVVLESPGGSFRYEPSGTLMTLNAWTHYQVPLAGGGPWTRTAVGSPSLADVTQVELHHDTWGYGFVLHLDGLTFGRGLPILLLAPRAVTAGGTATATIVLPDPAPAGGATVSVTSTDPAAIVPPSVTVPQGETRADFAVATGSVPFDTQARITWTLGPTSASALILVRPQPGILAGTVVSAASGQPVSGATVTLSASGGTATTDAAGAFSFSVAPGSWSLTVAKSGWVGASAGPFVIAAGGTTQAGAIPLTQLGTLTAQVVDSANGQGVAGVSATVSVSGGSPVLYLTTDATGRFTGTLAPGGYTIACTKSGWAPASVGPVSVSSGAATDPGPITFRRYGTLDGTVVSAANGQPVSGANVAFNGSVVASTLSNGTFSSSQVPAASASVLVTANGFEPGGVGPVTVVGGETLNVGTISLTRGGTLTGRVVSATNGYGFLSAQVTVVGTSNTVTTGADGAFSLPQASGTVSLRVEAGSSFEIRTVGPFTVVTGQTTDVGTLGLRAMGTATGTVRNAQTGDAVPGVLVRDATDPTRNASTNTSGAFAIGVPLYQATLELSKTGFHGDTVTLGGGSWNLGNVWLSPAQGTRVLGSISSDVTWDVAGSPWVVDNATVESGATVTVAPGAQVRFDAYGTLTVRGRLLAVGSPASPIDMRSAVDNGLGQGTYSIAFDTGASVRSEISHAEIRHGTSQVSTGQPLFRFVRFLSAGQAPWLVADGSVELLQCDLSSTVGLSTSRPARAVLSYWGATDGPSGEGPGGGVPVGAGVEYEPWLESPPVAAPAALAASVRNRTFNPGGGISAHVTLTLGPPATWNVTVRDQSGVTVRTFSGSGPTVSVDWDGRSDASSPVPDGTYSYSMTASDGAMAASPVRGRLVLDSARILTLTGVSASESLFSPNGDGIRDTTTISGASSYPDATWTLRVRAGGGTVVRTATWTGTSSFTWDGRSDGGSVVPDGDYAVEVTLTDDLATATATIAVAVDASAPVVALSSPLPGAGLSNLSSGGATDVQVTGTATDARLASWTLEVGEGSTPTAWTHVRSDSTPVSGSVLATWATGPVANGVYTLRLRASDTAGSSSAVASLVTVANISVTASGRELNVASGQTVTLTTVTPVAVTETIVLKDMAGTVVRTLESSVPRAPGTYTSIWDGKGEGSTRLRDGQYRWVATFTDGTHNLTIDRTAEVDGDFEWKAHPGYPAWDPFANEPLRFGYTFDKPGEIGLVFMRTNYNAGFSCDPPSFCRWFDEFQPSGAFSYEWAGVDDDGVYRPDIKAIYVLSNHEQLSANAVVVSGGRPKVTNVAVSPSYYAPDFGTATISFSLQTFQNAVVPVTITVVNQETKSILRTISLPSAAPGVVTTNWNGRTDAGLPVAPGLYTVTVKAQDSVGHVASGQIQMAVEY